MKTTRDVALLAPVPLEHLEDGAGVCRAEGKVAFGSRAWELFRELDKLRQGTPVDVYIYPTHEHGAKPVGVQWHARYIGHVNSHGGAHPDGMRFRPPSTANYATDNSGMWAIFWEVEDLIELPAAKCIPVGRLRGLDKIRNFNANFIPRGPIFIENPEAIDYRYPQ